MINVGRADETNVPKNTASSRLAKPQGFVRDRAISANRSIPV